MAISSKATTIIILTVGLVLISIGCVLIPVFNLIFHDQIEKQVPLTDGSETFSNWKDPPVPVYMKFYVYDLANPTEVVNNGAKPRVIERGPFTYREIRPKYNITFYENNTLSYIQPKGYVFDMSRSVDNDNKTITTLNLVLVVVSHLLEGYGKWTVEAAGELLKITGEEMFKQHTVREIIFGYNDTVLTPVASLVKKITGKDLQYNIGLFAGMNMTNDGIYDIFTGKGDIQQLNIINKWNGNTSLPYWTTPWCNMVNGTDGTLFHPFVSKQERLYLFSSDICRSIYMDYVQNDFTHGINTYKFVVPSLAFADHQKNPDNIGYCTPNVNHCLGAGVLNVTGCRGAPVIISNPHFYEGDPKYINAVDGMKPNKTKHETYLDVEPITGAVMNAAKRLQINIHLKPLKYLKEFGKIKEVFYPMAWLEEGAFIDESSANKFKSMVMTPLEIMSGIKYGLIALGGFLCLIAVLYAFTKGLCSKSTSGDKNLLVNASAEENA